MTSGAHTDKITENPQDIAEHAIGLLERKLFNEHGLILHLGAELEYTVIPRQSNPVGKSLAAPFICADTHDALKASGFRPASQRTPKFAGQIASRLDVNLDDPALSQHDRLVPLVNARETLFPDSNYVAYSYEEDIGGKFEAVISHQGRHDTLPADGRRALTFARSIDALRNSMATANQPNRRLARDPHHQRLLKGLADDWQPTFDGVYTSRSHDKRTHGLHINLSLSSKNGDAHCNEGMMGRCKESLKQLMNDGAYLLLSDESSLDRNIMRAQGYYTNNGVHSHPHHKNVVYLEITHPAANSNPYYATMLTLLGVHQAQAAALRTQEINFSSPHEISHEAYQARFTNPNNTVIAALNTLEPELGNRFARAIHHCPPGRESPAQGWSAHR